jgi:proteasome lid subunit RPN8/RPN11
MKFIDDIYVHAANVAPEECCGVVIEENSELVYIPCENIYHSYTKFLINPKDYANAEDRGTVKYIVHSHTQVTAEPTVHDLVSIEKTKLPWIIVNPYLNTKTITYQSGFILPLKDREFSHGIVDCYTLIKDYYKQVLNIGLPEYDRPDLWWHEDLNLYDDRYTEARFVEVKDLREHDVLLMRVASNKNNHGAVYIGNNKILHHPMDRKSKEDIYGGWWQKITSKIIRHRDLI